jgi:hypothetical protein
MDTGQELSRRADEKFASRVQTAYDKDLLKVHLAWAAQVLPGPDYYSVLRWNPRSPPSGTIFGSWNRVRRFIAARPAGNQLHLHRLGSPVGHAADCKYAHLLTMTSNEFFDSCTLADILGESRRLDVFLGLRPRTPLGRTGSTGVCPLGADSHTRIDRHDS